MARVMIGRGSYGTRSPVSKSELQM
eukprot:COSAG02_NODE_53086_length_304_cov_0.536585_1_plen_24_part_10